MNQYIEAILILQFLGKKELGAVTVEVDEQEYPLHDLPTSFELDLPLGVNMSDHYGCIQGCSLPKTATCQMWGIHQTMQ